MKRYVNMGLSCVTAAIVAATAAAVSAQTPPAPGAGGQTAKPAPATPTAKPAPETQKPAPPASTTKKPADGMQSARPAMETKQAGGAASLGPVNIPRAVKADGKELAAGTYQVRVTETTAAPPAPGQTPQYERWAEFLRGGKVVGREVVTVVPASDIKQVAEVTPPGPGGARTEILKGGDYLRVWLNRGGNHYLIHFNIVAS